MLDVRPISDPRARDRGHGCLLDSSRLAEAGRVLDARAISTHHNANIHRGVYPRAEPTPVRGAVSGCGFVNCRREHDLHQERDEAINLVAYSWGALLAATRC